tara:strand:- start:3039 stop:3311 length:273 start_codon:yes stop_codon:yes gene_type:complete
MTSPPSVSPTPSASEIACSVGVAQSEPDRLRFQTHKLRYRAYTDAILGGMPDGARVADCDPAELSYLDEFHYTADAAGRIATALAQAAQS